MLAVLILRFYTVFICYLLQYFFKNLAAAQTCEIAGMLTAVCKGWQWRLEGVYNEAIIAVCIETTRWTVQWPWTNSGIFSLTAVYRSLLHFISVSYIFRCFGALVAWWQGELRAGENCFSNPYYCFLLRTPSEKKNASQTKNSIISGIAVPCSPCSYWPKEISSWLRVLRLGSLTVMCRTCNPEVTQRRRFDSAPGHCRVMTLGKLFTHMRLCHQAV